MLLIAAHPSAPVAAVLGRISAVFLTGEAAVGLIGAVAGPVLAQAAHLAGLAATASLVTLAAAVLTCLSVPRLAAIVPQTAPPGGSIQTPRTPAP